MLRNYLKTALRFLLKNKTFSLINISGLAVGTLCCLYIVLYVQDQYSYDEHHTHSKDIYRVTTWLNLSGDKHNNATASPPIAPAMKNDFAEVLQFTRVINTERMGGKQHLLRYNNHSFYEKNTVLVDSTFFDVFSYHFISGDPKNALSEPYSLVLLKSTADKVFGTEDPIGKVIEVSNADEKHDYKVTAVVDETAGKSHIRANMFMTMNSGGLGQYVLNNESWAGNNFTYSFVKLHANANVAALESKLPAFLNKYGAQQMKAVGMQKVLHLQPLTSIHTTAEYDVELSKTVSTTFLYVLLLIAGLIQLIACINFMNLSTARASKRAKEVGVRKVVGAGKKELVKQFLGESFLLTLIGILIALPLLVLALPWLNSITESDLHWSMLNSYKVWMILAAVVLLTGFIAGSYPAFYLSAFQAVKVIKGNFTNQVSAAGIRRSLVVFQFALSVVLITGIIIIYSQLEYIKNKDLGFEKDQKLIFNFYTKDAKDRMPAFMNDLRQLAEIKSVSKADNYLGQFVGKDHGVFIEGSNMANSTNVKNISSDEYFVKANGIHIINGRDFRLNDSGKVLVNETLLKKLGVTPENAPGTRLYTQYEPDPATFVEIAGVMKDFNYNSLHGEVKPFMLRYWPGNRNISTVIVNTSSENYQALLGKMETIWNKNFNGVPFDYAFLDNEVQKQYQTEITLSRIINSFTLMAILISCLGLFGLAAFSAEQRSKEIGIRKVLGASVTGVVQLLSKDFLKLVGVAIIIAVPVAWWAMNKWLQAFAFRVDISWWMFALAGLMAILIAVFAVSFQAIKAAIANPVKSLKNE